MLLGSVDSSRPVVERRGHLDALIDAIAPITVAQIVPGEVALQAQPSTRRAGNKPFAIEGMNQDSKQEPLQTGQRYLGFQAGVQLANRTGALNEIEFSEFVTKVQRFADALGAMADVPNMLNEVSRARELDQFASEHDAQLSLCCVRVRHPGVLVMSSKMPSAWALSSRPCRAAWCLPRPSRACRRCWC
jgi:hypothetical protein